MTTATVSSPGELETGLLQALTALPRSEQRAAPTAAAHAGGARRVWAIPARARGFTGRAVLLAALEAALRSGVSTVVQAVAGMGGIGKTTTAIEYAHRHRAEFDLAWWIPAEDPTLVAARLGELAHALQLAATTDGANISGLTATATQCTCVSGTSVTVCSGSAYNCTSATQATYVEVDTQATFSTVVSYPGIPSSITVRGKAIMQVSG